MRLTTLLIASLFSFAPLTASAASVTVSGALGDPVVDCIKNAFCYILDTPARIRRNSHPDEYASCYALLESMNNIGDQMEAICNGAPYYGDLSCLDDPARIALSNEFDRMSRVYNLNCASF